MIDDRACRRLDFLWRAARRRVEGKDDRRAARIGRADRPRRRCAAPARSSRRRPVEGRGDARIFFRSCNEPRGDEADEHRGAEGVAIDIDEREETAEPVRSKATDFRRAPVQAPQGQRRRRRRRHCQAGPRERPPGAGLAPRRDRSASKRLRREGKWNWRSGSRLRLRPSAKATTPTARVQCGVSSQKPVQETQTKKPMTTSGGTKAAMRAQTTGARAPSRPAAQGAGLRPRRLTLSRAESRRDAFGRPQIASKYPQTYLQVAQRRTGSPRTTGSNHMGARLSRESYHDGAPPPAPHRACII